jgi:hypothetical protein
MMQMNREEQVVSMSRIGDKAPVFKTQTWEGVISLPWNKLKLCQWLDLKFSFIRNPYCAFIGVLLGL